MGVVRARTVAGLVGHASCGPLFCVIVGRTRGHARSAGAVRLQLHRLTIEARVRRRATMDRDCPNGRSAYVSSTASGGAVWQYTIDPTTGKLTPKSPATAAAGFAPHNIVIAANGKNAYVITVANSKVAQYRINQRSGTLSPKPLSTATTVLHPEAIVIAANGKSAYVTSENDPEMSQYKINPATGKITPMTPATVKTASGAFGVAATPDPPAK